MFFESWYGIWRITVVGVLGYIGLITVLRISGKRTLSKMNAFDLIITVALGSTFASLILSKDVPLAEGLFALLLLICLQFVIAWSSVRFSIVENIVKSEPTLLFFQGNMLNGALRSQRVTAGEVKGAIRNQGIGQLSEVEAVILETDGSFSVIRRSSESVSSVLNGVKNYPPRM